MNKFDFKEVMKTLRLIASKAIDLKNNGLVQESDILPILHYEEMAEEIIIKNYIYSSDIEE